MNASAEVELGDSTAVSVPWFYVGSFLIVVGNYKGIKFATT